MALGARSSCACRRTARPPRRRWRRPSGWSRTTIARTTNREARGRAMTRIAVDGRDRLLAARDATLAAGTARLEATIRDDDENGGCLRRAVAEVDFARGRVRLSAPHHARRVLDAEEAAERREHWRGI